jgi:type IV pili sensor histidine kinase/response regulator
LRFETGIMMAIITHKPLQSRLAVIVCITSLYLVSSPQPQANEIQVGRYSLYATTPTEAQKDLLKSIIKIQFPDKVQTVGEAVRHLLQGSGYRLARAEIIGRDTLDLFVLPLPEAHRSLGPMPLQTALETLVGPAFRLVEDPVHRLLTFERCHSIKSTMAPITQTEAR